MSLLGYIYNWQPNFNLVGLFPPLVGLLLLLFFIYYINVQQPRRGSAEWIDKEVSATGLTFFNRRYPLKHRDVAPLIIISLVFTGLAVFNLGDSNVVNVTSEIEIMMDTNSLSHGSTHMNNMYFDEIYFVRTAVEHIENINPYEISHPPLGKEIISLSILTFGMSPLGWRLLGALFGVLMLVIMYIFIKNMFGRTTVAICGALLFGFDFMRFVQTRMATIDTYAVTFILLAFFFMYRHVTTDPDADFKKSLAPLALSGLFFGLSFAVKWTGFYAGAGLLIIYIIRLCQLNSYYSSHGKRNYDEYLSKTLLYSVLFFVIIPVFIYYLTYIPYGLARGMRITDGMLWSTDFFNLVWSNQVLMFRYHSQLVAEHPFSSQWWQWIINTHPILYVNGIVGDTRATFGAFGNPVIWWGGFLAMVVMAVRVFTHRDGKALFILIGFLTQLLPWVAVTRILFAYHYFPSTLFLVLALAHVFNTIAERWKEKKLGKLMVYGYTAVAGVVFAIFYPSLSGMYMPTWYYSTFVKWFNTWPF